MDDKDALWAKFGLMQEAKAKKTAEDEKAQKEKSAIAAAAAAAAAAAVKAQKEQEREEERAKAKAATRTSKTAPGKQGPAPHLNKQRAGKGTGTGAGAGAGTGTRKLTVTAKAQKVGVSVKRDSGTTITGVAKGSQGEKLGLSAGMRIVKIDRKGVKSSGDVTKALAAALRRGRPYPIELEVPVPAGADGSAEANEVAAGGAQSTKEATPSGHRVVTVASGTHASAGPPAEPEPEPEPEPGPDNAAAEAAASAAAAAQTAAADVLAAAEAAASAAAGARAAAEAEEAAEAERKAARAAKLKADAAEREKQMAEYREKLRKKYAEKTAAKRAKESGDAVLHFKSRREVFNIKGGRLDASDVDARFGLADDSSNSFKSGAYNVHLSKLNPRTLAARVRAGRSKGTNKYSFYVGESPIGTFSGLEAGAEYHVYIDADTAEETALRESADGAAGASLGARAPGSDDGQRGGRLREGCSCLWGNPCVDQYVCQDWENRYEIAKANGWNGYKM